MRMMEKERDEVFMKFPHTCDYCGKVFTWEKELKENPDAFGIGSSCCSTCGTKRNTDLKNVLEGGGRRNPKIAKLFFGILLLFFLLIIYNILDILWNWIF